MSRSAKAQLQMRICVNVWSLERVETTTTMRRLPTMEQSMMMMYNVINVYSRRALAWLPSVQCNVLSLVRFVCIDEFHIMEIPAWVNRSLPWSFILTKTWMMLLFVTSASIDAFHCFCTLMHGLLYLRGIHMADGIERDFQVKTRFLVFLFVLFLYFQELKLQN